MRQQQKYAKIRCTAQSVCAHKDKKQLPMIKSKDYIREETFLQSECWNI